MHQTTLGKIFMASTVLVFGGAGSTMAQYPDRPIRLIVPFATGGGTDLQGRLVADKLRQGLGQTILVENRTGNGGLIGAEAAVKSAPDGYTVLMTTASISVNTVLQKNSIRFDLL